MYISNNTIRKIPNMKIRLDVDKCKVSDTLHLHYAERVNQLYFRRMTNSIG